MPAPTWVAILFFNWPLPSLDGRLFAARQVELARRCVAVDRRTRTNRCALAYRHRRDQLCIRADEYIVFDDGAMFVRAIIIAGDRASTDVHSSADRTVADVAEMLSLIHI